MITLEQAFLILGDASVSRFLMLAEQRREILYSERDCRVGGQFGRRLSKLSEDKRETIPTVYRKAFLWGCANFLTPLNHEMIVVGFGRMLGTRNAVDSILKVPGERHNVILLPDELAEIHAHLDNAKNNSILLVHNHPDHIIHTALAMLMGDTPLPSLKDRNSALNFYGERLNAGFAGFPWASIRFFLVQNDDVTEFSGLTPALLLDLLRVGLKTWQAEQARA
jgi:hypothetical protein